MTAHGNIRGHHVTYDWERQTWLNEAGESGDTVLRARCASCALRPTPEGHDACLGTIPGVVSACCGHGRLEDRHIELGDDRDARAALVGWLRFLIANCAVDEGGVPKHLAMPVTVDGRGPAEPLNTHRQVCWCGDEECAWTLALTEERQRGYDAGVAAATADGGIESAKSQRIKTLSAALKAATTTARPTTEESA